ncbi:hypothetical protein ACTFIW_003744 [Dictyostelium discoideum]
MGLLVKLGFKLNLEKSVLDPINYFSWILDCCSTRKLAGLKGKLIALKDAVIPFRLYTRRTNKFHSQCLTLFNGDWNQSFPIPQDLNLFPSYDYVLTTDASESGAVVNNSIQHVIKSSRNACAVNGIKTMSETEQLQAEYSNRQQL